MSSHIFPFLWLRGESAREIEREILSIKSCGIDAFCVESRPHPAFLQQQWWDDMDFILSFAKSNGMQVWLLDDIAYPTGSAAGCVPDVLKTKMICQTSVSVQGGNGQTCLDFPCFQYDGFLGAYGYPAGGKADSCIDLSEQFEDGKLHLDLPVGDFQISLLWETARGAQKQDYIDMLNPASTQVLIDTVYQPHYERYREYFGSTFAGFFSDEPRFNNFFIEISGFDNNAYECTLGIPAMTYPYSGNVRDQLTAQGYRMSDFLCLWFDMGARTAEFRCRYMEIITDAYALNFSRKVGDWCRRHGVRYTGHIIEDMNAHTRTAVSAGHYFKSQSGQDLAGIDVVLHQIKPFSMDRPHPAPIEGGVADPAFFNYTLPVLAVSSVHLNPLQNGNSLCEIFGAYGWSESIGQMKWMLDLMLVRGINHFVPHAFSMRFPDDDCPPHFYANGRNPAFPGFQHLMKYAGLLCGVFSGGKRNVRCAILYHAEAEWSGKPYISVDPYVKALLDNQIDVMILPAESLPQATDFDALIVPESYYIPKQLQSAIDKLPVVWADEPQALLGILKHIGIHSSFALDRPYPSLQVSEYVKEGQKICMLFNSGAEAILPVIKLPFDGKVVIADFLSQHFYEADAAQPFRLPIEGGASKLVCSADYFPYLSDMEARNHDYVIDRADDLDRQAYQVFIKETGGPEKEFCTGKDLNEVYRRLQAVDFCGTVVYSFDLQRQKGDCLLDFGQVSGSVRLYLNGIDRGIRICKPYRFDVRDGFNQEKNIVRVEVAGTLGNKLKDPLSLFQPAEIPGLRERIRILHYD